MITTFKITSNKQWVAHGITIGHYCIVYEEPDQVHHAGNDRDKVRLHFGLKGDYKFSSSDLGSSYDLIGGHHNLIYSNGLSLEVTNKSTEIETFGLELSTDVFLDLFGHTDHFLQRFCFNVRNKKSDILVKEWGTIDHAIQKIIDEVLHPPFEGVLAINYRYAKAIELMTHCLQQYKEKAQESSVFLNSTADKEAIIRARDLINGSIGHSFSIVELAKEVGINEFKLKNGFKEMFGLPLFSYYMKRRLQRATQLLKDTEKPISEISYLLGYSSPQHFSRQYKDKCGVNPTQIRKHK